MKTIKIIFAALSLFLIVAGCDEVGPGESAMRVRMTDAPGPFDKVNVEVRDVQVHVTNRKDTRGAWMSLPTNAGIYDLLTLQNNVSVLLTDDKKIPAAHIDQMRLILGSKNSVMMGDVVYPLKTPSAMQTGLKFKVDADFADNRAYEILIDFDANESIVIEGNNSFLLKPVIKVKSIREI